MADGRAHRRQWRHALTQVRETAGVRSASTPTNRNVTVVPDRPRFSGLPREIEA
ncbi:hypothetical protein C7S13_5750 [Burkholderia cepacia]|nr:hypothetical protein [Burkholderia cepacia]